tara:strand:+ start:91 stop:537 length:447 start_codon:yes stop_codon:yes gene_type:complete
MRYSKKRSLRGGADFKNHPAFNDPDKYDPMLMRNIHNSLEAQFAHLENQMYNAPTVSERFLASEQHGKLNAYAKTLHKAMHQAYFNAHNNSGPGTQSYFWLNQGVGDPPVWHHDHGGKHSTKKTKRRRRRKTKRRGRGRSKTRRHRRR